ncbi:class I SAM-dependent methyltransferase [Methyloprofundus sp.]|uniref:class I SAM-dependent methyltransferase n=1 Tax=Methyloprofundus sp. TaxID=2020875 RepID=UPI003D0EEC8F
MTSSLGEIENITINHYDQNAIAFWQGTKDHDVSQNRAAFLAPFAAGEVLDILDFGCGPGRDVKYFQSLGHRAVGLDGSKEFCHMAREHTQCEILQQNFLKLTLAQQAFDGIFANASLFHIPSQELPRILVELHTALRPGGILFISNPRGNQEGWSGQRYGNYMQLKDSQIYLQDAGFAVLDHYYRPTGKPKNEQPWLAIVSRKIIA